MLPNMANDLGDEFVGLCHQGAQRRVCGYVLVVELLAQASRADQMRIENGDTKGTGSAGGSTMDEQSLDRNVRVGTGRGKGSWEG